MHDVVVASSRLARGDASVAIGVNMHMAVVAEHGPALATASAPEQARAALRRDDGRIAHDGVRDARRGQRAGPGPDAARHGRDPHGRRLADRRAQGVLHVLTGGDRPLHGGRASPMTTAPSATATRGARRRRGRDVHGDWDALGMRASGSHSVTFDGVDAPGVRAARRLPHRGRDALHGPKPQRRRLPRVGVARHRRGARRTQRCAPPASRATIRARARWSPRTRSTSAPRAATLSRAATLVEEGTAGRRRAVRRGAGGEDVRQRGLRARRRPRARARPAAPATAAATRSPAPTATSAPAPSCTPWAPTAPTIWSARSRSARTQPFISPWR